MSADGHAWFLINASPDLRAQLAAFSSLHPPENTPRRNPFEAILLTNADLDHTLGLLLMREGSPLRVLTSAATRGQLEQVGFARLLDSFCGVEWLDLAGAEWSALLLRDGSASGLLYRTIALASPPPIFAERSESNDQPTMAFCFRDERTGGTLLVAPDVFEISDELRAAVMNSDAVLFDGTFWTEDELGRVKSNARRSAEMGHLTISDGSLELLKRSPARRRIYVHLNNTNPVLPSDSAERASVECAGVEIGYDGLEFEL